MRHRNPLAVSALLFVALLSFSAERCAANSDYVGSETCLDCHEEYYETYTKNYHAIKGDPRTPGAQEGCESCHGPGGTHVGSENAEDIVSFGPATSTPTETKNFKCLRCHTEGTVARWHGSIHENRGLSCAGCHTIHAEYPKKEEKQIQITKCTACHQQIKPQLLRQSRHPIRDGKISCSDCHNPHGAIADKMVDAQHVNLKCFQCHPDLRGPFLWAHPSVVEDCSTCHTPHGSSRSPLLKAKMPYLCQRCHSNVAHPSQLQARRSDDAGQPVYRVLNNRGFYRACLNCHVSIHGSNHPSGKSLLR